MRLDLALTSSNVLRQPYCNLYCQQPNISLKNEDTEVACHIVHHWVTDKSIIDHQLVDVFTNSLSGS